VIQHVSHTRHMEQQAHLSGQLLPPSQLQPLHPPPHCQGLHSPQMSGNSLPQTSKMIMDALIMLLNCHDNNMCMNITLRLEITRQYYKHPPQTAPCLPQTNQCDFRHCGHQQPSLALKRCTESSHTSSNCCHWKHSWFWIHFVHPNI
jgi:hypothetical protein